MAKSKKSVDLGTLLRSRGLRLTNPRKVILDELVKTDDHLLAKDIYLKINKSHPDIGLTTVYRTLDLLVKMNIVNKFEFGEGQSRYELAWEYKEHHHHLVCLHCGRIIDYHDFIRDEVLFFERIQKSLSRKYKFSIDNHEVYFYGHCQDCR